MEKIINRFKPNRNTKVGVCIIDLQSGKEFNFNDNMLLYPASAFKLFIGAVICKKVDSGEISKNMNIVVRRESELEKSEKLYPICQDSSNNMRDMMTIYALLGHMIAFSDNLATNNLLRFAAPESINDYLKENNFSARLSKDFIEGKTILYRDKIRVTAKDLALFMKEYGVGLHNAMFDFSRKAAGIGHDFNKDHHRKENWMANTIAEKCGFMTSNGGSIKAFIKQAGFVKNQCEAAIVDYDDKKYAIGIVSEYRTYCKNKYFHFNPMATELLRYIQISKGY
ncbi:MAG: class A beta-lactamase-related serine hydrolase [Rickettsiales bacterium]|jgi:hypothetical protein|nr:class A beta-lactamase-related serine hydrolase [Rickettsiales bacterium]